MKSFFYDNVHSLAVRWCKIVENWGKLFEIDWMIIMLRIYIKYFVKTCWKILPQPHTNWFYYRNCKGYVDSFSFSRRHEHIGQSNYYLYIIWWRKFVHLCQGYHFFLKISLENLTDWILEEALSKQDSNLIYLLNDYQM